VEVADFTDAQIQDFADKWFKTRSPQQLDESGRSPIGQLFWQALQARKPIKELATNPLLLTLLCLEFEESSEFPQSRAELYERGVQVLLRKWDSQRQIQRDEVYKRLPIQRKASLLGQLALQTFERGEYFFRRHVAERLISQYIQNLPDAQTDPEALLVDSRAVLQSIEAQHGLLTERAADIYSFSHLTFHEYFAAKNILDITDPTAQATALQQLVSHITEPRWREVFLLVAERMDSADYLLTLMQQQIDQMVADDAQCQALLTGIEQKARSMATPYKPAAIRAFYFALALALALARDLALDRDFDLEVALDLALDRDLDLARDLARDRDFDLALDLDREVAREVDFALALDLALVLALALALDLVLDRVLALDFDLVLDLALDLGLALDRELQQKLQQLQDQLPARDDREHFKHWWSANGPAWTEQLRAVMIHHRNIGHYWQFTDAQIQRLRKYHDANKLLVACLNSECYVSRAVRDRIEATLLTWPGSPDSPGATDA
jgi:predicted NACHT family NTPase